MVRPYSVSRFLREDSGITLVEALLVMPIVLLMITTMVELGAAMYQWNLSVKAVHIGARHASVSTPLVGRATYNTEMESDWTGINEGDPTPSTVLTVSCGAGTTACETAEINRLLTGGDGVCGGGSPRVGMCDVAPWIGSNNVLVTYSRTGLGYVGRPFGAVSTVTVELQNLTFDFFILDELLPGLGSISIPPHRVSATSEDICNQVSC